MRVDYPLKRNVHGRQYLRFLIAEIKVQKDNQPSEVLITVFCEIFVCLDGNLLVRRGQTPVGRIVADADYGLLLANLLKTRAKLLPETVCGAVEQNHIRIRGL